MALPLRGGRARLRVILLGPVQKLMEPGPGRGDRGDHQRRADQHHRVDEGEQQDHDDQAPQQLGALAPEPVDDRAVSRAAPEIAGSGVLTSYDLKSLRFYLA